MKEHRYLERFERHEKSHTLKMFKYVFLHNYVESRLALIANNLELALVPRVDSFRKKPTLCVFGTERPISNIECGTLIKMVLFATFLCAEGKTLFNLCYLNFHYFGNPSQFIKSFTFDLIFWKRLEGSKITSH